MRTAYWLSALIVSGAMVSTVGSNAESQTRTSEQRLRGVGMILIGVPAVAFGALGGAVYRTERWEEVNMHPLPVHIGFLSGSRVVVVHLSFGI